MKTHDARLITPVEQQQLRNIAIELFLQGKSRNEILKIVPVSRQTIYNWFKDYFKKGRKKTKLPKRGRPKGTELLPWQKAQIVKTIKNYCPDDIQLPFFLWTRAAVKQLIRETFDITRSEKTIGRYLDEWGFIVQKPKRLAYEQDENSIKKWFLDEYPRIVRQAKKETGTIYWGDEMGLKLEHNAGRSYSPKGKTPVVKRTRKRFGCNMISTITNLGRLNFMIFQENFTEDVFLKFLKQIIRQSDRKVFLIVDRHPVHRSKKISIWLKMNEKNIRLFCLPPYCPELNLDEFLNQDVTSSLGKNATKTNLK